MATIYATLIRKGLKTIGDVPVGKREEVEAILTADDSV
ncbi:CD1375 family protein [Paenibacillus sp. YIM B09110]